MPRMTRKYKDKDELMKIAREVVDMLRTKELPIWQAREVLKYADSDLDWEPLRTEEVQE